MIFIYIGRSSSAGYGVDFKWPEKPKSPAALRQRAEELAAVDYSEQELVPFRDETSYQEFLDYRLREFGLEPGATCSN